MKAPAKPTPKLSRARAARHQILRFQAGIDAGQTGFYLTHITKFAAPVRSIARFLKKSKIFA
ncbi:hypothetical protein ACQE3E_22675 [Methylomonas sp. MED-D]|uniref:hypothetical protein n=1 Tax=Methylomonas sp. MED-D TaxID=3418768 RepID=UPI0008D9D322|nr:hypothetical protein BJL95_03580 [Methylomonas sp. LWB]